VKAGTIIPHGNGHVVEIAHINNCQMLKTHKNSQILFLPNAVDKNTLSNFTPSENSLRADENSFKMILKRSQHQQRLLNFKCV
jgi:hypothetical protein